MKIKEIEKGDKYLDPFLKRKKVVEHVGDNDTNCEWYAWNNPQKLRKVNGKVRNWKIYLDHPDYSIVEISQNTEKSSADLRRIFSKTLMKDHHLVGKTLMEYNNNDNNNNNKESKC